ncbi:MAG: hypothetical protein M1829_006461 [Trizodia sp. TS-e1964]|nr:MAG: hypothetical protein M1829_006461 [Trizodia sp. TS-e1964]
MSRVPQPKPRIGANGEGGQSNGSFDQAHRRYDYENHDVIGRDNSLGGGGGGGGSRERRAGGYETHPRHSMTTPPDLMKETSNLPLDTGVEDPTEETGSGQTPAQGIGAAQMARGDMEKAMELDKLKYIKAEWEFMIEDQCIPVQVALQLMDTSSIGRADQYEQFKETHKQLQKALKAIVNEHHQGFNSSIGTFHRIESSIQSSQLRIRTLKESLNKAKDGISVSKPELKGLAATSQAYDDMLQVLGQIEHLQMVAVKLEARISEKRFLTAVEILQDALQIIRRPEMENLSALSDLKVYLSNQETSLTDILLEELHSHLYLKSPYCHGRWKPYSQRQQKGPSADASQPSGSILSSTRNIHHFLSSLELSVPMIEDASRNPEADSFYYIQLLVESLHRMGCLEVAVNLIDQRLPVELFRVVDKTCNEVDQRHPGVARGNLKSPVGYNHLSLGENNYRATIIFDLLWTLYSKFEAIAEGHRVLHDVILGIVNRDELQSDSGFTGGFKELWKLYQNEIRTLLHSYLSTEDDPTMRQKLAPAGGGNPFRSQRDKTKKIFKLSDMEVKSAAIESEQEKLDVILKISAPGLVSGPRRSTAAIPNENNLHQDNSAMGHKLLIEPSVFNMGLLLPPSLAFLQRLKDIVPPGSKIVMSTLTSFLDDFLINVFHPQLDETLTELSAQAITEVDAFQEDPHWPEIAAKPIYKGTAIFFNLIQAFCRMLHTIPQDQAFSQLIVSQMVTYYDKCCGVFKALVAKVQSQAGGSMKASASYASESGEIHDTIKRLWTADSHSDELILKEIELLTQITKSNNLDPLDLMLDQKTIMSLCMLYTSIEWLSHKIKGLRHLTDNSADSSRRNSDENFHIQRWTLIDPSKPRDESAPVYLPMTQETISAFDGIITSFEALSTTVLLTLHMEIRCQILSTLHTSMTGNYELPSPVQEPDPRLLTLIVDLIGYDKTLKTYLIEKEHHFLTNGLSQLIDHFIVSSAPLIKILNMNGHDRIHLNILVLQQNLKNIEEHASLARSTCYFDLFAEGPEALVQHAKDASEGKEGLISFSHEEFKTLVELCFSEAINSPRRELAIKANRNRLDCLLQLSEYTWND